MNLLLSIFFPLLILFPQKEEKQAQFKIYVFVAETCPICQYYTKKIREISEEYTNHEVVFVFPNKLSTDETVKKYFKKYKIDFKYILDKNLEWVNKFDAEITPEVFIYREDQDSIYYQGRIDDNYYQVGKRKLKIQSDDLINALNNIKNEEKIKTPKTNSIGCYISKK